MALTNTGGSRNQSVTIRTYVEGSLVASNKYWITQGDYLYLGNPVTPEELANLPEGDFSNPVSGTYAHLLEDFKTWVEAQYTDLIIGDVQTNNPYDAENAYCPVTIGGGGAV